jgi:hypothetical protein
VSAIPLRRGKVSGGSQGHFTPAVAGANFLTRNEGQIHRHLPSPGDLRVEPCAVEPWAPLTRAPEQGRVAARSEPGAGGRAAARSQVLTFSARP